MAAPSLPDPPPSPTPDTGCPSRKHVSVQVVRRGDATLSSNKKSPQRVNPEQIRSIAKAPGTIQVRVSRQSDAELSRVPSESILDVKGIEADVGVLDVVKGEEASEACKTVAEGLESGTTNAVSTDGSEAAQREVPEGRDITDPRARLPWRKPPTIAEGDVKPEPVMGATAWPALAEACNIKMSEHRKGKARTPQPAQGASIQESLCKTGQKSQDGSIQQQGMKHKSPFKGSGTGLGRPAFQPIENGASSLIHPTLVAHRGSEPFTKHSQHARLKGSYPVNQHVDYDRVLHHRNDCGAPFSNSNRKWRNNHRDQGRGNFGWQHHGRAYENTSDMFTLLHEQRIGPRNMPRPQSFININPGFYSLPHFQNGSLYYLPPVIPEFVHPPYFPPVAPAGGMQGPDALSLHSMLLKQIDYYFSVENLCRDVFLRTHMDEEGFVPVSVIAQFNRVRNLSPNPMVILEALLPSVVVEVQHDRIRRRNDGGKWRLSRGQVCSVNPVQDSISTGNLVVGAHREPEQAVENGLVSYSLDINSCSTKLVDLPLADVEHGQPKSDSSQCNDDCIGLAESSRHLRVDDVNFANSQHHVFSGSGAATISSLCGDGSTNKITNCSPTAGDLSGCQNPNLKSVPDGSECADINAVAYGEPSYWKAPEGLWMADDAYCVQSCFKQDTTQLLDSEFLLSRHEVGDEHHGEANNRDIQRLISVPCTPLGSFIAVP